MSANGGGVFCEMSAPIIAGCTIVSNDANSGGGVACRNADPSLTNCVLAGNRGFYGGGLECGGGCRPKLLHCTISGNRGAHAGGIYSTSSSHVRLAGCIVWGNTEKNYVLVGEVDRCVTEEDPRFAFPGVFDFTRYKTVEIAGVLWGVPGFVIEPPDFRLLPGSPAIDGASAAGAPAADIEGRRRPCGAGPDIGAYELCAIPFRRGDADGDGELRLNDAIRLLGWLFLGDAAPACLEAADANDSESLDLSDAVYGLTFQFLGGSPPRAPFPGCGTDPTPGPLGCAAYEACPGEVR
jgi:hypothetical protein